MKHCYSCKEKLDLSLFFKDKSRSDGYEHRCKQCCLVKNKNWRKNNREKHREYWKKYRKKNKDKRKKYLEENKLKTRARAKLNYAVRMGRIIRPTECPTCGKTKRIEAHHPDHSKPLEVMWTCKDCHHLLE